MLHLIFAPVFIVLIIAFVILRIATAPFRYGRWHRRRHWGYGSGWGYGGYGYGRPRGMGLLTILAIVALERIFTGRRYY